MHIDKKTIRSIFLAAGGCVVLAWILLKPEQVGALSTYVWGLISPFVVGATIAFIFNVPMRAIERFLEGIKKPGLRRTLAILLTLAALALIIAFVVEMLIPQITATVESLAATIPHFIKRMVDSVMQFLADNPEIQEWVLANTEFANIDWASLIQKAGVPAVKSHSPSPGAAVANRIAADAASHSIFTAVFFIFLTILHFHRF